MLCCVSLQSLRWRGWNFKTYFMEKVMREEQSKILWLLFAPRSATRWEHLELNYWKIAIKGARGVESVRPGDRFAPPCLHLTWESLLNLGGSISLQSSPLSFNGASLTLPVSIICTCKTFLPNIYFYVKVGCLFTNASNGVSTFPEHLMIKQHVLILLIKQGGGSGILVKKGKAGVSVFVWTQPPQQMDWKCRICHVGIRWNREPDEGGTRVTVTQGSCNNELLTSP